VLNQICWQGRVFELDLRQRGSSLPQQVKGTAEAGLSLSGRLELMTGGKALGMKKAAQIGIFKIF